MRIAIGALLHEANTFSPRLGQLEDFRALYYESGADIPRSMRHSTCEISGFYEVLDGTNCEVIPTIATAAVPSGPVSDEAFRALTGQLFDRLQAAGQLDAILLALHGAMSIESDDDGDGLLLEQLRSVVGLAIPTFVTFDLHANLTARKARLSNAIVGYHTAPHTDHKQTGAKAARLLLHTLQTGEKPKNYFRKIPMITPSVKMNTGIAPLGPIIARAKELERNPRTPAISPFWMQPWLDIREAGNAINVVCYGASSDAELVLQELGDRIWETRHELDVNLWTAEDAIRDALRQPGGPFILADTGDPPSGGAPGDSIHLLSALVNERVDQPVLVCLLDPAAVRRMHAAGVESTLTVRLGGSIDRKASTPREFTGKVTHLSDGWFTWEGPIAKGCRAHMGRAAVFEIGPIRVLVHEQPMQSHDPAVYRSMGLEPKSAKIVVVKSPTLFRAAYEPLAAGIYEIETPGVCSVNFKQMGFTRIPRPMFPFDDEQVVQRSCR
jgi:microcystin degradation protein MlrC